MARVKGLTVHVAAAGLQEAPDDAHTVPRAAAQPAVPVDASASGDGVRSAQHQ